jgi:hypothetical protein
MFLRHRILRSPAAVETAAGAASPAPSAPAAGQGDSSAQAQPADAKEAKAAPEVPAKAEPGKEDKAAAPKDSDWQAYQRMQAKFDKNPNARPTKREIELQQKYDGKDEKLIEGWTAQDKPQGSDEDPAATPAKKDPPVASPVPKELEELVGEKSPLGAKTVAELPAKVKALTDKIQQMNGDFGAMGRVMKEAGVESLRALHDEVRGAKRMNALIRDLAAGRPEAWAYAQSNLGIRPPAASGRRPAAPADGAAPEGILDEALYGHISPQLKQANEKIERLERALRDHGAKVDTYAQDYERRQASTARSSQSERGHSRGEHPDAVRGRAVGHQAARQSE